MSRTEDLLRDTLHNRATDQPIDLESVLATAKQGHQRHRLRAVLTMTVVVVVVLVGVGSLALFGPDRQTAERPRSYPLPESIVPVNAPHDAAQIGGIFHARMTPDGACASLEGQRDFAFIWPPGYRVTLDPVRLLDEHGHVVARGGDMIAAGGGGASPSIHNRCAGPGQPTWDVSPDIRVVHK